MRIRILYLITELLPAGAERIVAQLATGLDPARYEVAVACLRSPGGARGDGEIADELRAAGIRVLPLRARGRLAPGAALRLAFELATFKPDLIHAHLFHANLTARLFAPLAPRAQVVATYHVVERRKLPLRRLLERWGAPREDLSVCVSFAVAGHTLSLGVRPDRLRVIHNGIDLTRFAPPADPPSAARAARARLGLPQDALIVGCVGRLDPQKAPLVLLEAFASLRRPDAVLVFAGEGPLEGELRARASSLGDTVRLLGFRSDVPELLAALDVFCLPSRWEGFGLALAEALAVGLPAVASDVDSLPEVLGAAGLLVPPDDPQALAGALRRLLEDPAERAALRARAPAQAAKFSLEAMRSAYAELYEELVRPI